MERKFASKLSQLKPAAEARKQASSQLKENILSHKLKLIEPVDYDLYVQQNGLNLRKDSCSRQLILLPEDDLHYENYDENDKSSEAHYPIIEKLGKIPSNYLLVSDCLRMYYKKIYQIKYKYYMYGENYEYLPGYREMLTNFNRLIEDRSTDNRKILLYPEEQYEIDATMDSEFKNDQLGTSSSTSVLLRNKANTLNIEKHGWLNYKLINSTSTDKEKNFKKYYFHLHQTNSPFQSRSNSIDYRNNSIRKSKQFIQQQIASLSSQVTNGHQKLVYVLECFKDVPGLKKNENPKYQIVFESNNLTLKNTSTKGSVYTFEIAEGNGALVHQFGVESQKQVDEWCSVLESILNNKGKRSTNIPDAAYSSSTSSSPMSKRSSAYIVNTLGKGGHLQQQPLQDDMTMSSFNESGDSNDSAGVVRDFEHSKILTETNLKFVNSFDLNKYLNESEEDLRAMKVDDNKIEQLNPFDLVAKHEGKVLKEADPNLECLWPDKPVGRKLLLECVQFKLNLNIPLGSLNENQTSLSSIKSNSFSVKTGSNTSKSVNPELFYVTFALYDASSNQKLSANFNWIPNLDNFISSFMSRSKSLAERINSTSSSNNIHHVNTNTNNHSNAKHADAASGNVFSLDGNDFNENATLLIGADLLKQSFFSKLTKALFTLLDVHDEIYLVARVEKILDGNSLSSSIQPYISQLNENTKLKTAIRINKKMNSLIKSKIVSYKQPFAWAVRPVYRKVCRESVNSYELDAEAKFSIFAQDEQHLTDDDLIKYLSDFKLKEKYFNNKLVNIGGLIDIKLNDYPANILDVDNAILNKSHVINSSLKLKCPDSRIDASKSNDYILMIDYFEPNLAINSTVLSCLSSEKHGPHIGSSSVTSSSITNAKYHGGGENLSTINEGSVGVSNNYPNILNSLNSQLATIGGTNSTEHKSLVKKAELIKSNDEFKSYLFVYPKLLKYDTQKVFSRARNILIKVEFRDDDSPAAVADSTTNGLKCIFKYNSGMPANLAENVFVSSYLTPVTHHNKTPQFYDEIKLLLPLNLTEKHHLLFKFYHVSCRNAKLTPCERFTATGEKPDESVHDSHQNDSSANGLGADSSNKSIQTLIGYAWLPVFKNGRLLSGEKHLPVACNLPGNYLTFEQIGLGQSIGPSNIKWVENMKPLFKVNLAVLSSVHTTDAHLANFYQQCEKLATTTSLTNNQSSRKHHRSSVNHTEMPILSANKRKAPILNINWEKPATKEPAVEVTEEKKETTSKEPENDTNQSSKILIDSTKEITKNSIKGLHAADIYTVIKFMPVIFNRLLNTLLTTVSSDVAIHAVRALLHFSWQMTLIGKLDNLKGFIKYVFHVDYRNYFSRSTTTGPTANSDGDKMYEPSQYPTIHNELISNLVLLIKQNYPIQDMVQTIRLLRNCWFFLELSIKSLAIYSIQYRNNFNGGSASSSLHQVVPINAEFYTSLRSLYELLAELIIKYAFQSPLSGALSKDNELLAAYRSCNLSLAIFIKKSLNILNRKFLFGVINKYLETFQINDKHIYEIKFEFIRTICNHEHFISFSLPILKAVSNIKEFTDMKYEFILSDQFRQFHFLVGVVLSQLCISLNESKEHRKYAISIFRNILCKHSYDDRYANDKVKLARIASLYIPFIDILIENLSRLDQNLSSTPNKSAKTQAPSVNMEQPSRTVSHVSSLTITRNSVAISTNICNSINSSVSISNGSVYATNFENGIQTIYNDPLSIIAGVVNPNKLHDHLDSLIGPISDNDSLSSADDANNFKNANKRASSSIVTSSANNSDNIAFALTGSHNTNSIVSGADQSTAKSYCVTRKDKLESNEIKDLLLCAVFILKNMSDDAFLGLWFNYDDGEFVEFLSLLELCLKTFRYKGKTNIEKLNAISKGQDIKALIKNTRANADQSNGNKTTDSLNNTDTTVNVCHSMSVYVPNGAGGGKKCSASDLKQLNRTIVVESNLCHQVSVVILNITSLILVHYKDKLCENNGDNILTKRLMDIYFYMLQTNQSQVVKLKVFASLRLLINKATTIFLDGHSNICASLCLEILKCFNSKFCRIRNEACILLYMLMRKNYEYTKLKSIPRVHSQTIISVSQLIGNMKLSINNEVLECLSIINQLAFNDQTFKNTRFSLEVDDLTKRIRNIFMATAQMKTYQDDSEMLIDSQYSLAKSYANCLELRKTWLESMASLHIKEKNYSEAAHCYLHIAAFVAENLKHQGMYTLGCSVFKKITPNIELEEINEKNDIMTNGDSYIMNDLNEVQYTQSQLLDYLCKSAEMLKLAERYDFLPDIFKLAVAIYEPSRDYEHLQQMHQNIQKAYSYLAERDQRSREKPLAAYYRVSFFGKMFESENNKVYIYKEPSNTKLFEICERLRKVYAKRFNSEEAVEIVNDSKKPNELKLDTDNKNYIQVTFVQPYFEDGDVERGIGYFERNNNLKKFYYETPYKSKDEENNLDSTAIGNENEAAELAAQQHSELLKLCKRKTILETSHSFPYVKKRVLVVYEMPIDLNPLETAIDEIRLKIEDFESILKKKDLTLLELYLQGGIMPQVHKGPLAYAEAFLEPNKFNRSYSKELKRKFKSTFKRLIDLYQKGIDLYQQLTLSKSTSTTTAATTTSANNDETSKTLANCHKHVEMHRLLQEKFNELENTFRNLLLIDGDLELYYQQLSSSKLIREQEIIGLDLSTITSSQA